MLERLSCEECEEASGAACGRPPMLAHDTEAIAEANLAGEATSGEGRRIRVLDGQNGWIRGRSGRIQSWRCSGGGLGAGKGRLGIGWSPMAIHGRQREIREIRGRGSRGKNEAGRRRC